MFKVLKSVMLIGAVVATNLCANDGIENAPVKAERPTSFNAANFADVARDLLDEFDNEIITSISGAPVKAERPTSFNAANFADVARDLLDEFDNEIITSISGTPVKADRPAGSTPDPYGEVAVSLF